MFVLLFLNSLNHVTCGLQKSLLWITSVLYGKLFLPMAEQHVIGFSSKTNANHSSHAEETEQTAGNSISDKATARRVQLR